VKFTPADGRVTASVRRLPQGMRITVADTGIGIAPEEIAHVLQPFYQADSTLAHEHAGTGLGLPLAKQLIELHGGSMTLESCQNAGTTVTVLLPASRILDEAAESAA
jgi:signal transduction histidine kinase